MRIIAGPIEYRYHCLACGWLGPQSEWTSINKLQVCPECGKHTYLNEAGAEVAAIELYTVHGTCGKHHYADEPCQADAEEA